MKVSWLATLSGIWVLDSVHLSLLLALLLPSSKKRRVLPWWQGEVSPANAGDARDTDSKIPGLGRSPGGGNSNPLQYSHLENPMDTGAWWATVHVFRSRTRPRNTHKKRCSRSVMLSVQSYLFS